MSRAAADRPSSPARQRRNDRRLLLARVEQAAQSKFDGQWVPPAEDSCERLAAVPWETTQMIGGPMRRAAAVDHTHFL